MSIARPVGLAVSVAVCLALAGVSGSAAAQTVDKAPTKAERAAARDAYDKGTAAFERGDYATAVDSFVKANALIPSVQAMYWIAQAQDKLGHVDAAIEAYEAITARADFSKLSDDKAATVKARLAALKAPPPSAAAPAAAPPSAAPALAEAPPPAEPPPAFPVTPPPAVSEPPPPPADDELSPKRNTFELGVLGGVLFVSNANGFQAGAHPHAEFRPTFQLGARAAFFPLKVLGLEAEWAHGFSHWKCAPLAECRSASAAHESTKGSARFDAWRGHLIAQLPTTRVIPFGLVGAGLLHEKSSWTGKDNDFLFEVGAGVKLMATRLIVPRLDLRLNMTPRRHGGFTDGVAFHPEILLGVAARLGD